MVLEITYFDIINYRIADILFNSFVCMFFPRDLCFFECSSELFLITIIIKQYRMEDARVGIRFSIES